MFICIVVFRIFYPNSLIYSTAQICALYESFSINPQMTVDYFCLSKVFLSLENLQNLLIS